MPLPLQQLLRDPPIGHVGPDTDEAREGAVGERVREELDYTREAKHAALYRHILCGADFPERNVRVPDVWPRLSTGFCARCG